MLARRYLAIPATSAAIESTFSIGSNIITKSRNKLDPNTVRQLILLKSWKFNSLSNINSEIEED